MLSFQVRVRNECSGRSLLTQPVAQVVDQSSLAGPDFAGEQDKPLASFDPENKRVECLSSLRGEKQIPRVGVDTEWVFA